MLGLLASLGWRTLAPSFGVEDLESRLGTCRLSTAALMTLALGELSWSVAGFWLLEKKERKYGN